MGTALVKAYAQDLRSLLEEAELTERKAFLRSFIKRIEVNKGQAIVHYNLPMPPDGKIKQEVGVLPTVTLGGAEGYNRQNFWRGGRVKVVEVLNF